MEVVVQVGFSMLSTCVNEGECVWSARACGGFMALNKQKLDSDHSAFRKKSYIRSGADWGSFSEGGFFP
jgi:hypothetical protein